MQTILFAMESGIDIAWLRAAIKECIEYDEHGLETEIVNGKTVCFNCGGEL